MISYIPVASLIMSKMFLYFAKQLDVIGTEWQHDGAGTLSLLNLYVG